MEFRLLQPDLAARMRLPRGRVHYVDFLGLTGFQVESSWMHRKANFFRERQSH
jgi:hypothetical protein